MKKLYSLFFVAPLCVLSVIFNKVLAQEIRYSDDNSFKGSMVGDDIVLIFDINDAEANATFFFEKDGKNIYLEMQQKGDSVILTSSHEPNVKGVFRLRLVAEKTSAIGTWESDGKIKDVTVHKTQSKEWAQNADKKIASQIVSIAPQYLFTPSNIIKLNAMQFKHVKTENSLDWKSEKLSGVVFPRTNNETLNTKLAGLHYNFATQVLNAYKGTNAGALTFDCDVLLNSDELLSLKVEVKNNTGFGKQRTNIITYLFDKKTGQQYRLNDMLQLDNLVANELSTVTDLGLKQLLNTYLGSTVIKDDCNYEDRASMGLYTWALTANQLMIMPTSDHKSCNQTFSIPNNTLKFQQHFQSKLKP